MKRLILCLFVLIGAAAMSHVTACGVESKKAPSSDIKTYVGTYTEHYVGYCWDKDRNYCPECPVEDWWYPDCEESPAILIDEITYVFTGTSEKEIYEMGLKKGEVIEIFGILFSEDCVDYIDIVSIKKQNTAVKEVCGNNGMLDLAKPMFNTLGQPVDENYQGIVIQNGHKFVK